MNLAQTVTEQPTGAGVRWYAECVGDWLNPRAVSVARRANEFPACVWAAITSVPSSIHEIYARIPAKFHSQANYSNLNTQLSRLTITGKILRTGRVQHYHYRRLPK